MAIAPEGTRKKVDHWKTGFYYIALEAEIPILLVHFNYPFKKISFLKLFEPTGNMEKDINEMKAYFKRAE
jgi:1-acyl-sn-glycerol-3-phosphate acyltransferase